MYDFAIIGSGVSGARIAHRLTRGGARCVLIEAGQRFNRHTFPRGELGYSTQMFWGGGMEVSRDGRFGFLRGKCLGGTSVVNQADLNRFDDLAWNDWRDRSGIERFRADYWNPVYDEVLAETTAVRIPSECRNENARVFTRAFDRLGYGYEPILRAQADCRFDQGSDCIVCLGGCPRDSKQSALVKLIPEAEAEGLAIESEFEVTEVLDSPDQVRVRGRQRGTQRQVVAAQAVLAAGAVGNAALLGRSAALGRELPALGKHFCCHPQYMSFGVFDEPIDSHKGALQSVEAHDDRIRQAGVKFENVFAPPIAVSMLLPGLGRDHHALMGKYRHLACIEVAVRDEPLGTIAVDRQGKPLLDKPLSASDTRKIQFGLEQVRQMLSAAGARQVIECAQGFGLHLMGGCVQGSDPRRAVVNPDYQVFGHPRLWAADSSVFPAAPGINPSLTVMVLSVDASRRMLSR